MGVDEESNNTIASNKKSTSKKEPTSAPEITIIFAQIYYNSATLSMWVVFAYMCV